MESVLAILLSILIFTFGAAVGSFLNVVIYRIPEGEEIFKKKSHCPACKAILSPFELIPIFSYLGLWGKCKNCGQPISLQYPIVETTTALLFLASFFLWQQKFGANPLFLPQLFHFFLIISVLISVFAIDAKHKIIPDSVVKVAIAASFILILASFLVQLFASGLLPNLLSSYAIDFSYRLASALGVSLFFILLIVVTAGRGMGWGDVKFGFWLGFAYSAPRIFQVLFLSFFTGAVFAIFLIIIKKKKFGENLPFGPFLSLAGVISLFFGEILLDWYLKGFG